MTQTVYGVFLKTLGYDYDLAENGQQALDYAKNQTYGLIFLDIELPDMSGLTVCNFLRCDKKTAKIPIVILTGYSKWIEKTSFDVGATEFITKPISIEKMQKIIEKYSNDNRHQ